jgi:Myb-like DNA-binding domain
MVWSSAWKDAQQLFAAAFPLHTLSTGSNASLSARPAQPFSVCNRADNASGATQSLNKRPRFTADEDAKLVDLKEGGGWSWEDIQREFPGRSPGLLQVRYSTRLKEKTMRREKGDTG